MSYAKAAEILAETIEAIAMSPAPTIQGRLGEACSHHLEMLQSDELPPDVQFEFKELKRRLTEIPGESGIGAILATTEVMSDEQAVEITLELVRISRIVARHRLESGDKMS
jgi:hypothetical protein